MTREHRVCEKILHSSNFSEFKHVTTLNTVVAAKLQYIKYKRIHRACTVSVWIDLYKRRKETKRLQLDIYRKVHDKAVYTLPLFNIIIH